MKLIVCHSLKGGVGRTTAVVNLAHVAAQVGPRVLLWDLDPQASAGHLYRIGPCRAGTLRAGLEGRERIDDAVRGTDFANLDLLPADPDWAALEAGLGRGRCRRALGRWIASLAADYDYLLVDCPAGRSAVVACLDVQADLRLLPVVSEPLSIQVATGQLAALTEEVSRMGSMPFWQLSRDMGAGGHAWPAGQPRCLPGMPMTHIPWGQEIAESIVRRQPVGHFAPDSPVARAYAMLWWEIKLRLSLSGDEAGEWS